MIGGNVQCTNQDCQLRWFQSWVHQHQWLQYAKCLGHLVLWWNLRVKQLGLLQEMSENFSDFMKQLTSYFNGNIQTARQHRTTLSQLDATQPTQATQRMKRCVARVVLDATEAQRLHGGQSVLDWLAADLVLEFLVFVNARHESLVQFRFLYFEVLEVHAWLGQNPKPTRHHSSHSPPTQLTQQRLPAPCT